MSKNPFGNGAGKPAGGASGAKDFVKEATSGSGGGRDFITDPTGTGPKTGGFDSVKDGGMPKGSRQEPCPQSVPAGGTLPFKDAAKK